LNKCHTCSRILPLLWVVLFCCVVPSDLCCLINLAVKHTNYKATIKWVKPRMYMATPFQSMKQAYSIPTLCVNFPRLVLQTLQITLPITIAEKVLLLQSLRRRVTCQWYLASFRHCVESEHDKEYWGIHIFVGLTVMMLHSRTRTPHSHWHMLSSCWMSTSTMLMQRNRTYPWNFLYVSKSQCPHYYDMFTVVVMLSG